LHSNKNSAPVLSNSDGSVEIPYLSDEQKEAFEHIKAVTSGKDEVLLGILKEENYDLNASINAYYRSGR